MKLRVLVTGTDTEVGKTYCSVLLLQQMRRMGLSTAAMKPVASGCTLDRGERRNDDALRLMEAAGMPLRDYAAVNPYALTAAVSPHIAAAMDGCTIEMSVIREAARRHGDCAEVLLVEGAGGWLSPLGGDASHSELARQLELGVILVVGLRLGCINHALLSARAIAADGCRMVGWIGNRLDPETPSIDAVVDTLNGDIEAPCLGIVGFNGAERLDLSALGMAGMEDAEPPVFLLRKQDAPLD